MAATQNELAAAEQEYLRLLSGEGRNVSRLDELRNIIEVRKWQVNQTAGRYIRSHEAVQHISIRDRLNDFMQQHGTALAAALAPELMGYSELTAIARNCAIQRATDALREALLSWLAKGEKLIIPHRIATFLRPSDSGLTRLRWMTAVKNSPLRRT